MNNLAIYIHIPYCIEKCIYCDFFSITDLSESDNYYSALNKEIISYASSFSDRVVTSIFIGGGTPTILNQSKINDLILSLKENYTLSNNCEITIEANPETLNEEKLNSYLQSGINRISIGVQSFDEEDLKFLSRVHSSKKAIESINMAYEIGFTNINVDLIFSLPNQTREKWIKNLEIATNLPITHISTYSLIIEKNTKLFDLVAQNKVMLQDNDEEADIYLSTIEYLEKKKFLQYEVSNFSKENYQCLHNKTYWNYKEYIGFGASSHSFIKNERFWNYSSIKKYIVNIDTTGKAIEGKEVLTSKEMKEEYIMLALRSTGLNISEFNEKFNCDFYKKNIEFIKKLEEDNFVSLNNRIIKMTPKGYSILNEILTKLNY